MKDKPRFRIICIAGQNYIVTFKDKDIGAFWYTYENKLVIGVRLKKFIRDHNL